MIDPVHVYFYQGYYGPTIRLSLHDAAQARELHRLISQLAGKADRGSWKLTDLGFALHGLNEINVASTSDAPERTVVVMPDRTAKWCDTIDGWDHSAALVEQLLKDDEPGHQYLTSPGSQDATVIVSLREPSTMEQSQFSRLRIGR